MKHNLYEILLKDIEESALQSSEVKRMYQKLLESKRGKLKRLIFWRMLILIVVLRMNPISYADFE